MSAGKVFVRESGSGTRTVVLLHGYSDHGGTWCKVVPALAERHRVLTVDLPGFGRSAGHWRAPVLDHYVDTVAEVIADCADPVALIGNSLGAVTSLAFASTYPGRVDGVVLADMPGMAGIPRSWSSGARLPLDMVSRALSRPVPPALVQFAVATLYARAALHRPDRLGVDTRTAFAANYASRRSIETLLAVGRAVIPELARLPIPEMVNSLSVPALLVWGERDLITPARAAGRVHTGARRRVAIIPDAGHCPQLDSPSEFLELVLPFLERSFSRPAAPGT
ncbi:alpha/beta hydrolase [Rhodococcus ruber Chol-4]|uniref:Alpha/beta hydrolase n=1 Tax=Rhodococcus ruber TaxID=1830 RepID=A0A098BUJ2_9NOCA|nr:MULTISPECIES: alpha/beta hydrolase [Rhodococcus]MDO2377845.1 alpha/beta hydrolase [Rhodococcus ruber]RIK12989.1 MAG: alpha/beta hydrolase [Acidobacteriota bacterium]ATQ31439.1 alpha/beta hydrolase [Rhodococcus ruber]AUM15932.1 alpha/beta hydrolase [Rhodococcus ruber]AWG98375.1 alpha/beta hydrolase [Rhodococcus ruber]